MYQLAFSFQAVADGISVQYLNTSGAVIGAPDVIASFSLASNWHGWTLNISDDFRGFIEFLDQDSNTLALFAMNPEEAENTNQKISTIISPAGAGALPYEIILTQSGTPVANAEVWITSDVEGQNLVAGTLYTDSFGKATFYLDAGTYYMWRTHSRYKFTNPTRIEV